jgi:hypothetical protein
MQISKRSVLNVLRAINAAPAIERGKEDTPTPEKPKKEDVPPKEADTLKIINRVFFYSIDPNKKISFSNLNGIMSGTDEKNKEELLDNLKGGNTADFNADYFKWKSLFVKAVSQQDESKVVVYEYDLNPWGTKASEGKMVKSNVAGFNPPPPGDITSDPNYKLFATINEIPEMINLSQGPEAIYSTDSVSDQYANRLLTSRAETTVTNKMNYDNFKTNIFSYYRIWVPITANELRNVDGSKPTSDQLPPTLQRSSPGHYKGGGMFFKKFMAEGKYKVGEEKEEAPEAEVKKPVKPGAPEFTPVTKETKVPAEKEAMLKEINKDDPVVNQYEGDNSCMKDLAYRQHEHMKIRKQAIIGVGGTPKKPGMLPVQVPEDNTQAAKKVTDKVLKTVADIEKLKKGLPTTSGTQTTQTTQSAYTSTGMGKYSSTMVKNVVKKYFNI